jgi:hypothetical protein
MDTLEIIPGVGLRTLRFGAEREEVESLFGPPEEMEEQELDGVKAIAWYFWSRGISMHFEEHTGFRLGALQVDDPKTEVRGKHFIGVGLEMLLQELEALDWGDVEVDEDPEQPSVFVESLSLSFNIVEDVVDSIQISPLLDENDEEIWPPRE